MVFLVDAERERRRCERVEWRPDKLLDAIQLIQAFSEERICYCFLCHEPAYTQGPL